MLNSAVVVLREMIEALLLISLLLSMNVVTKALMVRLAISVLIGLMAATLLSFYMSEISDLQDGTGQEILISSFLLLIMFSLLMTNLFSLREADVVSPSPLIYQTPLLSAIGFAISYEMTEVFIYFNGIYYSSQSMFPNVFGALLGSGIAMSFSIIIYYLLKNTKRRILYTYTILALVSAGALVQSIAYLMQSGIVEATPPIFDSNGFIKEDEILGQLLYAIFGYESTPTLLQLTLYLSILILNAAVYFYLKVRPKLSVSRK